MTARKKTDAAKQTAEALFDELRSAFTNAERIIIQIIDTEAWRHLGYTSFAEAWNERMAGVRLATDAVKAHVVYALLESKTVDEVVEVLNMPEEIVANLKRQKKTGIPAGLATVRRHLRRHPGPAQTIRVTVTEHEYAAWTQLAVDMGKPLTEIAAVALREYFAGQLVSV